jgi:hypothetical protein
LHCILQLSDKLAVHASFLSKLARPSLQAQRQVVFSFFNSCPSLMKGPEAKVGRLLLIRWLSTSKTGMAFRTQA